MVVKMVLSAIDEAGNQSLGLDYKFGMATPTES